MRLAAALLICLFSFGCSTPITRFDETNSHKSINGKTLGEILRRNFTDEAYEVIKDIPVVQSDWIADGGMAAGTNFWSKVAGIFVGIGTDRRVVLSPACLAEDTIEESIIHEYIHQLHDMQLDGEGNWIDEDEFLKAYEATARDHQYAGIVIMTERYANRWITNTFGISEHAEYIAFAGACIALQGCPWDLGKSFRKILRKYQYYR